MAIEDKNMKYLYSKQKHQTKPSRLRVVRSLTPNSGLKDENRQNTVEPGNFLGFSRNGHWYFEDIKYNHLQYFLDQHKIHWNGIVYSNLSTLLMPEDVASIAKNNQDYQLYISYKDINTFFSYLISEVYFILENKELNIKIDLSKDWRKFLKEFKQENQIETINQ